MPMKLRSLLCSAAFSGAVWSTMLAGPASADFISPGTMDASGQIYSQGMVAESGLWGGEIYSQGMMMSTGDFYSPGMEIATIGGTTNSSPPNSGCIGTAANCTDNVTNTPTVSGLPTNQSVNLASLPIGVINSASA